MKEYLLSQENKIIFKVGNIAEEKGDALLSWSAINLKAGPDSFYAIHRKAGMQVSYSLMQMEPYVKEGTAFTSIAGMIDFFTIIHSILPIQNEKLYNDSFFNIINTIIGYKKKGNICRNLYLTFPSVNKKNILDNLFLYIDFLKQFSFVFVCSSEQEYNEAIKIFEKHFKKKIKTSNFFFNLFRF